MSRVNHVCDISFIYLGNLNDGPKDGEEQAKKPTVAPFESQCMYSVSVTFKQCNGWSLILPSNLISVYRYFNCIIIIIIIIIITVVVVVVVVMNVFTLAP